MSEKPKDSATGISRGENGKDLITVDLNQETIAGLRKLAEAQGITLEEYCSKMFTEGFLDSPTLPDIPETITVYLEGEEAEHFDSQAKEAGLSHDDYAIHLLKQMLKEKREG